MGLTGLLCCSNGCPPRRSVWGQDVKKEGCDQEIISVHLGQRFKGPQRKTSSDSTDANLLGPEVLLRISWPGDSRAITYKSRKDSV